MDSILKTSYEAPEPLPGEPSRQYGAGTVALIIVKKLVRLLLASVLMPPLWLLYLPLRLAWGRPPCVPAFSQLRRYIVKTFNARPSGGVSFSHRVRLLLELLRIALCTPLHGLAWYLDEILYGREIRAVKISQPLFEISAQRSGSTQLVRYLEEDPQIVAPNWLQSVMPYLWLWKLSALTIGRFVNRQWLREKSISTLPKAFAERHEMDPLRTDTLDIPFSILHLNTFSRSLGPDCMRDDFLFGHVVEHNRELWENDFVRYVDALGRKALLFAGSGPGSAPDGVPRRLLIKGHFLAAADALEQHFPDARFLTIVREPMSRIQSAVNFVALMSDLAGLEAPPWSWCVEAVVEAEISYCDLEMTWYQRAGARRCIIRFSDYVNDLEGTLRKIYRECLDEEELPPMLPRVHARRQRVNYLVDRSLAQLGVNEAKLGERLERYTNWCCG